MKYKGTDIFQCHTPRSGITFGNPEFEWILAAAWASIPYKRFRRLHGEEQSEIVAAYRTQKQMESVLAFANRPKRK